MMPTPLAPPREVHSDVLEATSQSNAVRAFVRRHRFGSYVFGAYLVSWAGVLVAAAAAGFSFEDDGMAIPVLLGMLPGPTVSARPDDTRLSPHQQRAGGHRAPRFLHGQHRRLRPRPD